MQTPGLDPFPDKAQSPGPTLLGLAPPQDTVRASFLSFPIFVGEHKTAAQPSEGLAQWVERTPNTRHPISQGSLWYTPVMAAFRRWRREGQEFKASLGYMRPCLKTKLLPPKQQL